MAVLVACHPTHLVHVLVVLISIILIQHSSTVLAGKHVRIAPSSPLSGLGNAQHVAQHVVNRFNSNNNDNDDDDHDDIPNRVSAPSISKTRMKTTFTTSSEALPYPTPGLWPKPSMITVEGDITSWIDVSYIDVLYVNDPRDALTAITAGRTVVDIPTMAMFRDTDPIHRQCHSVLHSNVKWMLARIKSDDFVPYKFSPRNVAHNKGDVHTREDGTQLKHIQLYQLQPISTERNGDKPHITGSCPDMAPGSSIGWFTDRRNDFTNEPGTNAYVDESYNITIRDNTIHIIGNSTLGLVRGLQTVPQLFFAPSSADLPSPPSPPSPPPPTSHDSTTREPMDGNLDLLYRLRLASCKVGEEAERGKWTREIISRLSEAKHGAIGAYNKFIDKVPSCSQWKYIPATPLSIFDRPAFAHRGVNLDLARNFIPKSKVMEIIDAISFVKMNKLHLHITDSQSWPLDVSGFEEISAKGAYHPEMRYTHSDIIKLTTYAYYRGIEIIPEVDIPGHIDSLAASHPEFIVGSNIQPNWYEYAAEPPSGQLRIANNNSRNTIAKILTNIFSMFHNTPLSASRFHIGGDEFNKKIYELDDEIKSSDDNKIRGYLADFVDIMVTSLLEAGVKVVVAWEEILLEWSLDKIPSKLRESQAVFDPKFSVIQLWRRSDSNLVLDTVSRGFDVILGSATHWYLDCGVGLWLDPNEHSPVKGPDDNLQDWCSPSKSWRRIYEYDPIGVFRTDNPLKFAPNVEKVLGAEVHLWGEQTDASNINTMLFPRVWAAAEVLWSPSVIINPQQTTTSSSGSTRNHTDASRRLALLRERLVGTGIQSGPIQMIWCLQHQGECNA